MSAAGRLRDVDCVRQVAVAVELKHGRREQPRIFVETEKESGKILIFSCGFVTSNNFIREFLLTDVNIKFFCEIIDSATQVPWSVCPHITFVGRSQQTGCG